MFSYGYNFLIFDYILLLIYIQNIYVLEQGRVDKAMFGCLYEFRDFQSKDCTSLTINKSCKPFRGLWKRTLYKHRK